MKRLNYIHRAFFIILVVGGLLSATLQAQEAKIADASTEETKVAEHQTEKKEQKEGISTPRKIAGFGVLAFLIGWMIWRNGTGRNAARQEEPEQAPMSTPSEEDK